LLWVVGAGAVHGRREASVAVDLFVFDAVSVYHVVNTLVLSPKFLNGREITVFRHVGTRPGSVVEVVQVKIDSRHLGLVAALVVNKAETEISAPAQAYVDEPQRSVATHAIWGAG
jgi:cobyrinic acid a,c-diamide synthase